jgi:hypothetical protein
VTAAFLGDAANFRENRLFARHGELSKRSRSAAEQGSVHCSALLGGGVSICSTMRRPVLFEGMRWTLAG